MGSETVKIEEMVAILEQTPARLGALLAGIPERWLQPTAGEGEWSPYDVLGHLIHGERADWMPRVRHIMAGDPRPFPPVDRAAQFADGARQSVGDLLRQFGELRRASLAELAGLGLAAEDMGRTGLHPAFGEVQLGQLLATWAVHDPNHLGQIVQTLAREYADAVGPWHAYLDILHTPEGGQ